MTVVAALELEDQIAAGEAAGEADGGHGGLGAAIDEADHLDGRHEGDDLFGQLDLFRGWRAVVCPFADGTFDGLGHVRVGMTQDQRPPRQHVVYVLVAVHIAQARAGAARREERLGTDGAEGADRRVHSARRYSAGPAKEFL